MELYLRWRDRYERWPGEDMPIGLILCGEMNREQIELLQLDRVRSGWRSTWWSCRQRDCWRPSCTRPYWREGRWKEAQRPEGDAWPGIKAGRRDESALRDFAASRLYVPLGLLRGIDLLPPGVPELPSIMADENWLAGI